MTMTPELWAALIQFAIKNGIVAAISIAEGIKSAKTIDDAIAALHDSKSKTWEDFKAEAQASQTGSGS